MYGKIMQKSQNRAYATLQKMKQQTKARAPPREKAVFTHKVLIMNDHFEPRYLKIQKGEQVEWSIDPKHHHFEASLTSLYHLNQRMHVISFQNKNAESEPIRNEHDKFTHLFQEPGLFSYHCSIYTRMRGVIEVVNNKYCIEMIASNLAPKRQSKFINPPKKFKQTKLKSISEHISELHSKTSDGHSKQRSESVTYRSESEMSQRLIEVPAEEDHLHSVGSQDESESPIIKKERLAQIFETNRGDFLNSEQSESKHDDSDTDEEDYMKQQRITRKVFTQINQFSSKIPSMGIEKPGGSNKSVRSMSAKSSSIEELKSRGYFESK